jgi:ATP-dependent DNA helicase RecG
MGKHPSCPFNPLLANVFFRAGYIESWGRGIDKINHEYLEHRIGAPLYDYSMSGLMLMFQANPQHLIAALGPEDARRVLGEKVGEKVGKRVGESLTPNQKRIISILRQNTRLSARELADKL